jgi:superfamily I DNA/RNA helicase
MQCELDDKQREAVESTDRAVLVVAGPGTGKTRVLTSRASWLTESAGVNPGRILAITYTNRAAAEMRLRLSSAVDKNSDTRSPAADVSVLTFHSWAYRLIRKYYEVLGYGREPVVYDEQATEQLLRRILAQRRIPEELLSIRHLKQLLDRVKARTACPLWDNRTPSEHVEEVTDVFRAYQTELKSREAVDFADLLLEALRLLICYPKVRDEIAGGIDHLLIDEFQDINLAQYRLVQALAGPEMSLFAVGDEDQTIYAFRGSSGEFMDRFVSDFGAELIPLGKSYRCRSGILYAAGTLIGKNRRYYLQPPKPPADLKENRPISLFEVEDENEEGALAAKLVRKWAEEGIDYRNIAILYRVHNLADSCERLLIDKGIPILRLAPDRQRLETPGDPLPILRLAVADTEWDWDRALGLPRDRLGELDDLRIRMAARADKVPVATVIGKSSKLKNLSPLAQAQLGKLDSLVRRLKKEAKAQAPSMLLNMVADHIESGRSPWSPAEDAWLASEEDGLDGFDHLSPGAIVGEWKASPDGIRVFHAPTVSALASALLIQSACNDILNVKCDLIPLPFKLDQTRSFPVDKRPAIFVGLATPAEAVYPTGSLFNQALYVTSSGISNQPPENQPETESFPLALTAHRLLSELVSYRPGGAAGEEIVFLDLETTGTDIFRAEIVELAAIRVHLKEGKAIEVGHFHSLVRPSGPIPPAATSVHGITDADVAGSPSLKEVLPRFLDFLGDLPLAGHNIDSYDLPILRRHAGRLLNRVIPNLTLDTLPFSKRLFPNESHRLETLAEKLLIKTASFHRALDDVRTNAELFVKMAEIDEASRGRAFSQDLPVALAIALAVDGESPVDPSVLRSAAARCFVHIAGSVEEQPFVRRLLERLTSHGKRTALNQAERLARLPVEWTETDSALHARIEFLQNEAVNLEKDLPDVTLTEYLAHMALLTDGDFESEEDAVRMMTLHAAKGLEFSKVILIGLEQGHLPHRLSINKSVGEIEEERRLCYVGMTRAREQVAMVYARRRFGKWRPPSMFVREIPVRATKAYKTKDRVGGG